MHAHIYIYWLTSVHMLAQHSLAKSSGMSTAMAMITGSLIVVTISISDTLYEKSGSALHGGQMRRTNS